MRSETIKCGCCEMEFPVILTKHGKYFQVMQNVRSHMLLKNSGMLEGENILLCKGCSEDYSRDFKIVCINRTWHGKALGVCPLCGY